MEIEMLQDLIDDLNDTSVKNQFLKSKLRSELERGNIISVQKYYNMLTQGENLVRDITAIIDEHAIKN